MPQMHLSILRMRSNFCQLNPENIGKGNYGFQLYNNKNGDFVIYVHRISQINITYHIIT